MVTRILLDPRRDLPGGNGFTPDPIVLEATPTGIREDGSVFVLPTTLSFTVNTAADIVQLPPPAASWAWRLVARQDGVPVQQRTVRFPDVPSIGYGALTDVDPSSLGETRGHARQWDATFFQLVTLIGQLQDEVAALTAGAPGAFDTFLEVATRMGLDETSITALQGLVAGKANAADLAGYLTAAAASALYSTKSDLAIAVAGVSGAAAKLDANAIPPYSLLQRDSFNGAAGTALSTHALDVGVGAWSQVTGTFALDGKGAVAPTSATPSIAFATLTPATPNYTATVRCVSLAPSPSNHAEATVIFGYADAGNYFYVEPNAIDGSVRIFKLTAYQGSQLAQIASTVASGIETVIRLDHWGDQTTVWINGVEALTVPDARTTTAAAPLGLRSGIATGVTVLPYWTDFKIETFQGVRLNLPRPTRFSGNPIIPLGASGAWDQTDVNNPNVVWDPVNARWVMYYSGYKTGSGNIQHMGVAYASSLYGPWTKDAGNPVFSSNADDGYYAQNGGLVFWNGQWWMAYASNNGNSVRIATAPAVNGPWTRIGLAFSGVVADPFLRVRQDGRTLEMWFGVPSPDGKGRDLNFATSTDGINWTVHSPVAIPRPPFVLGPFSEPSVYVPPGQEGRQMLVLYDLPLTWNALFRWIGAAITLDGGATWHYSLFQTPGLSATWDAGSVFDSFPLVRDGRFYLFRSGSPAGGLALDASIQLGVDSCDWNGNTLAIDQFVPGTTLLHTVIPMISGTAAVGQTLTAGNGTWTASPDSYTYQWSRGGTVIPGASSKTYLVDPADSGYPIYVLVTAIKAGYTNGTGTSLVINIPGSTLSNTAAPAITGTATTGQTLTVSNGSWTPAPDSYGYQWKRGGSAISGATSATYVLVTADEGQLVTATVTAMKSGYTSVSATSAGVTSSAPASPTLSSSTAPAISGSAVSGQTVTVSNGTWSATPDSYTYQWKRAGTAIGNATAQSYVLTSADVGQAITVTVTATKAGYVSASATSASITPTAAATGHDPATLSGTIAWWRADSITGVSDGAPVTTWADKSSNVYTATPPGTSVQPAFVASGVGTKPAVRFAGSKFLTSSAPAGGATQSIAAVIKPLTVNNINTIRGGQTTGALQFKVSSSAQLAITKQSVAEIGAGTTALTAGTAYVAIGTYNATTGAWTLYLNGTLVGSGTNVQTLVAGMTAIGNNAGVANGADYYQGDISEIMVFDHVLGTSERVLYDSYVQDRYGITVSDYS
jgi:hypothetical protein